MKIVTYVLIALLVVTLGAAAVFYLYIYNPMAAENATMKSGMPELAKAKADLTKYQEKESRETAWINPLLDAFTAGLSDEIKAGKAETLSSGNKIIINISEQALYLQGSYTFASDSLQLLQKIASLLKNDKIKGKEISIGNTTDAVQAQGKGRKRIPAKDARTLAADRSAALIKYLEKNGVDQDALIAAAYSSKKPEIGFKIKNHKTVIIIENQPQAPMIASKQEVSPAAQAQPKSSPATASSSTAPIAVPAAQPKPVPATTGTSTTPVAAPAVPQTQPKPIPIQQPAQPKQN